MAALTKTGRVRYLDAGANLRSAIAGGTIVNGDVLVGNAGAVEKAGADPTYMEGVALEDAGAGQAVTMMCEGTLLVGYNLSALAYGANIWAGGGTLNDATPGATNNRVVGKVVYSQLAPNNKAIRLINV